MALVVPFVFAADQTLELGSLYLACSSNYKLEGYYGVGDK